MVLGEGMGELEAATRRTCGLGDEPAGGVLSQESGPGERAKLGMRKPSMEVGLDAGFALAGDLAGDFLVGTARDRVGEAARVLDRVAFFSPCAPVATPVSVPLLGRPGGGVCESSASDSDETTIGFLRVARSLAMPPPFDGPGEHSNAE